MFKFNEVKFFVCCAIIFGIILVMLIPPFQSPDEDSHFKKAYVVSYGKLFPTSQDGIIGFYLPKNMVSYINEKLNYIGNTSQKYSYTEMLLDDRVPQDYSEKVFSNFSTVGTTPVAYAAPAIGIFLSRVITYIMGLKDISITNMLYFARIFSLFLYIFLVATAIKITPILKKSFCLIGLIPMSLSLAATISYDSVIISIALLAVAMILKLMFDDNVKKVDYRYIIGFGVIGFILLTIKPVYIPVLLPLIFVPKEKWGKGSIKELIKICAIILCISIGLYIINKIPSFFAKSADTVTQPKEQIKFVLEHPIYYIKIWLNTMISGRGFYISGLFGIFGLLDTYLITAYTAIYMILFFMIVISDASLENKVIDWRQKIIYLLGIIASVFGIFFAMYIFWTSVLGGYGVGANTVTGVQGRYFIPLIPIGVMLFLNNSLQKNEKIRNFFNNVLNNSYIVAFTMLLVSSVTILLRFWC